MINFMILGAWLLTLIILGVIVASTGLPNVNTSSVGELPLVWILRVSYLIALAYTMFELGFYLG